MTISKEVELVILKPMYGTVFELDNMLTGTSTQLKGKFPVLIDRQVTQVFGWIPSYYIHN